MVILNVKFPEYFINKIAFCDILYLFMLDVGLPP